MKVVSECPTCGRSDFKNKRGMKMHHKHAHKESIAGEEIECAECGDIFRAPPSQKTKRKFCSQECYFKYKSEKKGSESGVNVVCANCDQETNVRPYKLEQNKNIFCSRSCYGDWLSDNNTGENNPTYTERVPLECMFCGDDIEVTPYTFESQDRFFCSNDCQYSWRSENLTGSDAPAWSGGTARQNYGEWWNRQRELALKRDFHRCRLCNISQDTAREKYDEGLHVHHRTPFKIFDSSKKANRLRNLISLCKSCHHKVEWCDAGRSTYE